MMIHIGLEFMNMIINPWLSDCLIKNSFKSIKDSFII